MGFEQSRRDDLESLGYTLIYLLKGVLPWMNIKTDNKKEKYKMIAKVKMTTTVKELCEGLKPEFFNYMNYVKNLGFYEKPNYSYFRKLFRTLFLKCKYEYDNKYDWIE